MKKVLAIGKIHPIGHGKGQLRKFDLEWVEEDGSTSVDIDILKPGEKKKLEGRLHPN